MFCPHCNCLLIPGSRSGIKIRRCRECGYESVSATRKAPPVPPKPNHPEFPLFPFEKIRSGQHEFMVDVKKAALESKILLAQAPTGIGKTVATLSVLLEMALSGQKVIFFLTSKQSQHTIVIETLRHIAEASGRHIKVVDIIAKQAM